MTEKDRINNSQAAGYEVMSVLSDIASYLAAGLSTDEILEGIIGTLKRKLPLSRCTIWIRTADGSSFRPVVAPGDPVPDTGEFEATRVPRIGTR